jgi:short-subunit dehydrogenase
MFFYHLQVDFVKKYGEWAVVTGATDGLGKEYARELARRGMKVVLISRNPEKLQRVADELGKDTKSDFVIVAADFTKGKDIYPSIQQALHGLDIGVLVNNVGISRGG